MSEIIQNHMLLVRVQFYSLLKDGEAREKMSIHLISII